MIQLDIAMCICLSQKMWHFIFSRSRQAEVENQLERKIKMC